MVSNIHLPGNAIENSKEGNGRLIETISFLLYISNMMGAHSKQEATLDVYPSSVPRDVSLVVIRSCRSVIFHEGGIKHLSNLSIVTVEDAGEVVFHSGSFNQLKVCLSHNTNIANH